MNWIEPKVSVGQLLITLIDFEYKYKVSKVNGRRYKRKKPIKPFLSLTATLSVDEKFILGATYLDNTNNAWICTSCIGNTSFLKNTAQCYKKSFHCPSKFIPVSVYAGEKLTHHQ